MTNGARIPVALLMLASGFLAGCESSSPTMPTGPTVGTIELATDRPDGAALVVTQCLVEGGGLFPCTIDLQMTFSVVLNRAVDRALVQTDFYTASGRLCGATKTAIGSLAAETPGTLTTSSVYLGLQGSSTPPECGVPLQTTRVIAHLWQVSNGGLVNVLLTQDFSRRYMFTNP